MQITFNTESALDRRLIEVLLVSLSQQKAQPEVANSNAGSAKSVVASSDECADSGAVSVSSLAEAASAVEPKPKAKKPVERELTLEQTIDELPSVTYPPATIEGARSALTKYTSVKGIPDGMKLLAKYKANRIAELDQEKYSSFIKECIDGAR
ncbi:MAG: hypothetical protein EB015_13030 [Methylocystaceae bacterium]|nr:hypothetical protein [Methylocystaceae bacterium]